MFAGLRRGLLDGSTLALRSNTAPSREWVVGIAEPFASGYAGLGSGLQ
jgi:hypothetical protein